MNPSVYFISDVHLHLHDSPEEMVKREHLFDFLAEVRRQKGTLYILGDMFDFWFEYRYVIPGVFFPVLCQLRETVLAGCEVHFLGGNHDYWAGKFVTDVLGITVHYQPIDTVIAGKSFHLTHADGILHNDRGYRFMRFFFRNKTIIRLFRHIHPDCAIRLATALSGKSRRLTLRSPVQEESDRQEIITYGKQKLEAGAEYVITGHLHLPLEYHDQKGVIVNLGDWMKYFSFALFDGQSLHLCYWPTSTDNLTSKKTGIFT
ncbi:MAG TPA: UDP-2,3-diacylglucosamine diphosphatase [Candidatus Marinimicrobia bacterium]|nr:UDP-2,3-diacylglucosamine diphosphatase [Candidatus Neomarinimicrobiota bacterium]HRS50822.1 UDP-2,3-diacylglucosamine diphosphatase [Candidatus Neomarinimicrobiota bacterium]HRU91837.1 UDP-2,3-diacylglucosamine diphosphatase [Candidatus Neomarinimicrobiota bacterium]